MKIRRNIAIIVAGGTGQRMGGDLPKQYWELAGKPVIYYTLNVFEKCELVDEIVLVVGDNFLAYASEAIVDKYGFKKIIKLTTGGDTRQQSVFAGLSSCPREADLAIIHDAVRPFLAIDLLRDVVKAASQTNAAILAVPAKESLKLANKNIIEKSLNRDAVWVAQTPQVFKLSLILDAHKRAEEVENEATDDSQLYEQYCGPVSIVHGSYNNIKITTKSDFVLAERLYEELF